MVDKLFIAKNLKNLTFSEKSLFPVVSAGKLLSSINYEKLLDDIKKQINLPEKYYQDLYKILIDNFAEFVQILPFSNESQLDSLLNQGLWRAFFALYVQKKEKIKLDLDLVYMLFCAALLFDVAKVNEDRTIILSDEDGAFNGIWQPYEGVMPAKYYKIRRGGGISAELAKRMTPLLAGKLMPKSGFEWISKNPQVLNTWLKLLNNDYTVNDEYALILNEAHKLLKGSKNLFIPSLRVTKPKETALGEEFIEWLIQALNSKAVNIKSKVHRVAKGLFLEVGIFQEFCTERKLDKDWMDVFEQFAKLGFVPSNDGKYEFEQYLTKTTKSPIAIKARISKEMADKRKEDEKREVAIKGTFEASTHIKNGVLLNSSLIALLIGNQNLPLNNDLQPLDEVDNKRELVLQGLFRSP